MGHPDFRVRGKIFATLWYDDAWGMVKLTPDQQSEFMRAAPKIFETVNGAWGARGATKVNLRQAKKALLRPAMVTAWRNTAPKKLAKQLEDE
jgi:hypothetical protein